MSFPAPKYNLLFLAALLCPYLAMTQKLTYNVKDFRKTIHANKDIEYISSMGRLNNLKQQTSVFLPYTLEAKIAPPYLVFARQANRNASLFNHIVVAFEPSITLRINNDQMRSFYISPPNYMPQLTCYQLLGKANPNNINYTSIGLAHYSNGQAARFYLPNTNTINTRDGNFSTNFLKLDYTKVLPVPIFSQSPNTDLMMNVGFRWDVSYWEEKLALEKYGYYRVFTRLQAKINHLEAIGAKPRMKNDNSAFENHLESWDATLRLENACVLDKGAADIFSTEATLLVHYEQMSNISFMLKYYRGRDYMNINFKSKIAYTHFGISMAIDK
jgi:hypothetical protein